MTRLVEAGVLRTESCKLSAQFSIFGFLGSVLLALGGICGFEFMDAFG